MALVFIAEDGTGVADANAYASLAYVRQYHEDRGELDAWDGDVVETAITSVNTGTNALTSVAHPFQSGDGPVRLVGVDLPAGLAIATDYWLIVLTSSTFQLAASYANAIAATPVPVDLTDAGSDTMTIEHPSFDAQREAIIDATDYVEGRYAHMFHGDKGSAEQGLHFPASAYFDRVAAAFITDVPDKLKRGVAELALVALTRSLTVSVSTGGVVSQESKTSGPISRSRTYSTPIDIDRPTFPAAERWLAAMLKTPTADRA